MTIISLKDFILTGQFGQITLGDSKDKIIKYLGKPNNDCDFGTGLSGLNYLGFEFFYWTESQNLQTIQNDSLGFLFNNASNSTIFKLNKKVGIDFSIFSNAQNLTFKSLTEHLKKERFKFTENESAEHFYAELSFESGVIFDFENWQDDSKSDRNDLKLNGIRYFDA